MDNELKQSSLKWAGGKLKVMGLLRPHLDGSELLIEPFVGSGAVFNNVQSVNRGLLADSNRDLIMFHTFLKLHTEAFIKDCVKLFVAENNTEARFYELRHEFNTTPDDWRKATLFAYLNRHCFNGLCRYNKSGKFNVSFGKYRAPALQITAMRQWGERLQCADLIHSKFEETFKLPHKGTIYCDPPYSPASKTSNFASYTQDGFSTLDHIRLRDLALASDNKVIISNHDTEDTRELYKDFEIISFDVQRNISCKADERFRVKELLAIKQKNN